jgi:hypothetical protein
MDQIERRQTYLEKAKEAEQEAAKAPINAPRGSRLQEITGNWRGKSSAA